MGNSEAKKKKQEEAELKKLQERQKLISIASIFLEGKNIEKVSDVQKRIFLRKKGLTDQMVDEAFKRFKEKRDKQTGTQQLPPASSPESLIQQQKSDKKEESKK